MANNVYIGNRYVPVFADPVEWDNLRQYEPLTIVTYQGTAYTSRKTVPVGTALSNTEYWVVTGNYNAQVEQYRQEVEALATTVSGVSARVSILEDDIVVCVGDSYLEGYTHTGNVTSWGEYLRQYLNMDNDHFKKIYQGGIGLTTPTSYANLLTSHLSDFTTEQKNKVKYVILGGCYNDAKASATSIRQGMAAFETVVLNNFPNAELYAVPFGWQCKGLIPSGYDLNNSNRDVMLTIIRWLQACNNEGVRMADLVYTVLFDNRCFSNDYIHPNAVGQQLLGSAIFQTIFGEGFNFDSTFEGQTIQNVQAVDGTINLTNQIYHQVMGRTTQVRWLEGYRTITYTPSSSISVTANNYKKKIGTYKDAGFQFTGVGNSIPVAVYVRTTGSSYYNFYNASLLFQDDEIWLHFGTQINDNNNNFLTVENINQVVICNKQSRTLMDNMTL